MAEIVEPSVPEGLQHVFSSFKGRGGLEAIRAQHPDTKSSIEIYKFGASITSFKDSRGEEHLFVSEKESQFDGRSPIPGGIPIVFPQFCFGGLGEPEFTEKKTKIPFHGFAQILPWRVTEFSLEEERDPKLVLVLDWSEKTLEMWPYKFALHYHVTVRGNSLKTSLQISNSDEKEFTFQVLLHNYFHLEHISKFRLSTMKGVQYSDKVDNFSVKLEDREKVRIEKKNDSVYLSPPDQLRVELVDSQQRSLVIRKSASKQDGSRIQTNTTVWNPWVEDCRKSDFLLPEEYQSFVCVEPGIIAEPPKLLPGESITLQQEIEVTE